ncbi:hypothetical protein UPYG_G00274750 [Umbra pygmaea]|uniref:Uncharacterized protein n=1 Tax=Umbra pygmaea TaxID=75934 RepID=A0ABD0W6F0_UMBPY
MFYDTGGVKIGPESIVITLFSLFSCSHSRWSRRSQLRNRKKRRRKRRSLEKRTKEPHPLTSTSSMG